MSERLNQLLRQRALLQEHLVWLDREIAAATEKPASEPATATPTAAELNRFAAPLPPAPPAPPEPPSPTASTPLPVASPLIPAALMERELGINASGDGDAILEKYRVPSNNLQQDVRKGCVLYLVAAFVLTGLVVTLLYFMVSRR